MFATATLVAHPGAALVSREDLVQNEPPPATATWKPVKHSLIVDLMRVHQPSADPIAELPLVTPPHPSVGFCQVAFPTNPPRIIIDMCSTLDYIRVNLP